MSSSVLSQVVFEGSVLSINVTETILRKSLLEIFIIQIFLHKIFVTWVFSSYLYNYSIGNKSQQQFVHHTEYRKGYT